MTETPTIEVTRPRSTATRGPGPARNTATPRPTGADRFEAPLFTVPYPLEACRGAFLDARDVDHDDVSPPGPSAFAARVARLGRL